MRRISCWLVVGAFLVAVSVTFVAWAGPGGSGPSANGHANLTIGDGRQTFSFHARVKKDGSVQGTFEVKSRGQDLRAHGVVDCFCLEADNIAFMSGEVTKSVPGDDPDFDIEVGDAVRFRVVDNGEGKNDPVDEWTDIIIGGSSDCEDDFLVDLLPVEGGNIQVKP